MSENYSRRQLLQWVGNAGGSAAVYQVSIALGLIPAFTQSAKAQVSQLEGVKRDVVLLGAGLCNLAIAYELEKAGFDCTIIEASGRVGGRNLTIRSGDVIDEIGQPQVCEFDDEPHLYLNAGPARIPAHHHLVLGYCRELGVELEVFINENRHALTQDDNSYGGKPIQIREYVADARGFMTELLAKAVDRKVFDAEFSADDAEKLQAFVRTYGDLDRKGRYRGSSRAGYASGGMTTPSVKKGTLDFSELLKNNFWKNGMHWGEGEDQAAPLMQAVGGNDHIVKAFLPHLKARILLNAQVQSVSVQEKGVEITFSEAGQIKHIVGDYCFNSIPAQIMNGILNNFSKNYADGIASIGRGKLIKIAFQMKERFWERQDIYGGISWTNQPIEQIWYPSHGINKQKGVMLGSYAWSNYHSEWFGRMTPKQRLEEAIRQGTKVHPDYGDYVENGVSVIWHRMNHQLGCTASWSQEARDKYFKLLQEPEGRHYMVGDQISYHPGWQEGALSSAHSALHKFNKRLLAERAG